MKMNQICRGVRHKVIGCVLEFLGKATNVRVITVLSALFAVFYAYCFWDSVHPYWFHPDWTTDDATQQSYHFYKVFYPGLFPDDIVNRVMEGYLAPLHYWISYGVTWLVGDVIMMGHWVMLLQAVLAVGFLFAAVRYVVGSPAAFFSVAWLLHTRHIMQRLTGGLPRGWSAPLLTGYLYFLFTGKHRSLLVLLLCGCLLNPPVTFLLGVGYGLYLTWRVIAPSTRAQYLKPFLWLVLLTPVYGLVTYTVVKRPAEIGNMISYQQAEQTPEFLRPGGRFPFVPLRSVKHEVKSFGFQAFIGRFYNPGRFWKKNIWWMVTILTVLIFSLALLRKRSLPYLELLTFLLGIFITYFASRYFAFKLYVPDRHLQFPMGIFFISALSTSVWCALHRSKCDDCATVPACTNTSFRVAGFSFVGLIALGWLVFIGSGTGLYGSANFNYSRYQRGQLMPWIASNTPERALIAGHPTLIDPVMLFGMRQGYITTETAHPFYENYRVEVRRRLEIVLRAHYAADLKQFMEILQPEGIDYFAFKRDEFYPSKLKDPKYHAPFKDLLAELTNRDDSQYAFRQLPRGRKGKMTGVVPFENEHAVLVDLAKLQHFLNQKHE